MKTRQGAATSGRGEWSTGWRLVAAGATGNAITQFVSALGAVMPSLQKAFGWSRAQISSSVLIVCICVLLFGPVVGILIDRVGLRRMALWGMLLYAAAIAGIGRSGPAIWTWYLGWTIVGITFSATGTIVWTLGVGRHFHRQLGLAFALTMAGMGVGYLLIPLLAATLLPAFGWRGVYFGLSLVSVFIGWPLVLRFFHPYQPARMKGSAADQARPPGHEFAIIFSSLRFWLLIAIALLVSSAVGGVFVHFQPIMQDAGLSISQAASYAAVCGPASIGGHLLAGRLLDRYRAHHVAAIFFGVPAAGCLTLLTYAGSAVQSLTAAVALGFSIGIEGDVMAYLTAQYFGMKRYGVTFGIIIGCYSLGFGLAPVIAGTAFDALGSYVAVLWVMLAGLGVSVLLSLCLGQPPQFLRACSTTPKPASAL